MNKQWVISLKISSIEFRRCIIPGIAVAKNAVPAHIMKVTVFLSFLNISFNIILCACMFTACTWNYKICHPCVLLHVISACTLMSVNTHNTKCTSGAQGLLATLHVWCTGMGSEQMDLFCFFIHCIITCHWWNVWHVLIIKYHILLVSSRGYYKFQVEIGATTNRDVISKSCVKYKFMVFNLVLHGDYPRAVTTWGSTINQ